MTRCVECGKPVSPSEPQHRWRGPAGLTMTNLHREVTYVRHAACQARVEQQVAESRARAEQDRLATIRAMGEALGLTPEQVSAAARNVGGVDPYAEEVA